MKLTRSEKVRLLLSSVFCVYMYVSPIHHTWSMWSEDIPFPLQDLLYILLLLFCLNIFLFFRTQNILIYFLSTHCWYLQYDDTMWHITSEHLNVPVFGLSLINIKESVTFRWWLSDLLVHTLASGIVCHGGFHADSRPTSSCMLIRNRQCCRTRVTLGNWPTFHRPRVVGTGAAYGQKGSFSAVERQWQNNSKKWQNKMH